MAYQSYETWKNFFKPVSTMSGYNPNIFKIVEIIVLRAIKHEENLHNRGWEV